MGSVDAKKLTAQVAARHGLLIREDDPAMAQHPPYSKYAVDLCFALTAVLLLLCGDSWRGVFGFNPRSNCF
jgi:hypothetical protein